MSDSDKSDTQALILKQLKSIKVALWAQMVTIVLLTGGLALGGCIIVYYADLADRAFLRGDGENNYADTVSADVNASE